MQTNWSPTARTVSNAFLISPPNTPSSKDQFEVQIPAEDTQQTRSQATTNPAPSSAFYVARPFHEFHQGYNTRLLQSVGVDIWSPASSATVDHSATARTEEVAPTTPTELKFSEGRQHLWTSWTTHPSVRPSPSANSGRSCTPVDKSQPIDPAVIDYLRSLGLSPDKYASKLRCVGLDSGNRKDKLEEDLQRLTGVTVVEAMALVSGLRKDTGRLGAY